jgi:hypothetical protein
MTNTDDTIRIKAKAGIAMAMLAGHISRTAERAVLAALAARGIEYAKIPAPELADLLDDCEPRADRVAEFVTEQIASGCEAQDLVDDVTALVQRLATEQVAEWAVRMGRAS